MNSGQHPLAPLPMQAGRLEGNGLGNVESFIPKLASYSDEYVLSIKPTHLPPSTFADRFALAFVGLLRKVRLVPALFGWLTLTCLLRKARVMGCSVLLA